MNWKSVAYILYPLLIGTLLSVLLYSAINSDPIAMAGTIRKAELSSERPLIVRLAMGRTTAVSFTVRPEKVVPGNPQGVEINFVGRDLTLRPLGHNPGNLIVYTKTTRYVVLLQIGSEASYDDAVVINAFSSHSRPIRLAEDSFLVEEVELRDLTAKSGQPLSVLVRREARALESDSFPEGLRCKGCVLSREKSRTLLICKSEIKSLDCTTAGRSLKLIRKKSGS